MIHSPITDRELLTAATALLSPKRAIGRRAEHAALLRHPRHRIPCRGPSPADGGYGGNSRA